MLLSVFARSCVENCCVGMPCAKLHSHAKAMAITSLHLLRGQHQPQPSEVVAEVSYSQVGMLGASRSCTAEMDRLKDDNLNLNWTCPGLSMMMQAAEIT